MNRSAVCTALVLLAMAMPGAAQTQGRIDAKSAPLKALPPGSRIAVVARNSSGGVQVDRAVVDMLTTALRKGGARVVERQELEAVREEQRIAADGGGEERPKLAGADYLLSARATEFGVRDDRIGGIVGVGALGGVQVRTNTARVVLDVRLLDARTGSVLITDTAEGKQVVHGGTIVGGTISGSHISLGGIDIGSKEWSESALGKAARRAVDALMKRLMGARVAPEGVVLALTDGGEIIIDVGAFDGLEEGDQIDIFRPELTKDSKGVVVWVDERKLGRAEVTEIHGDRAKARPDDPKLKVVEGDRIRLQRREPRAKRTPERGRQP